MRNRTVKRAFQWYDEYFSEGKGRMATDFKEKMERHLSKARTAIGKADFTLMMESHARAVMSILGYIWSSGVLDDYDFSPPSETFMVGPTYMDAYLSYIEDIVGGENVDAMVNLLLDAEFTRTLEEKEGKAVIHDGEKPNFDNLIKKWQKA